MRYGRGAGVGEPVQRVGLGVPAQNMDRTIYNALMERRTTLRDVRVRGNQAYLAVMLLARVITKLGTWLKEFF